MPAEAGQPSGRRGVAPPGPAPAPWRALPSGSWWSLDCLRHGHHLEEPGTRAVCALPRGLRALTVRAAREGGARPRRGLPRSLRRGHLHQLFTRFLLSVGPGLWAGGACARSRQRPQPIQQHIWLHVLCHTTVVRLLEGTLGFRPTGTEFLGVPRWFCLPGLDPVLCAL
ncbi:hypothetical protein LEMLEM_LOCUS2749 [Lemmus lemmus]